MEKKWKKNEKKRKKRVIYSIIIRKYMDINFHTLS